MSLSITDIINISEKLEGRLNSYWNFYTLVVVATAGWLFSGDHKFTLMEKSATCVGLGVFFLANLSMIVYLTKRIVAFESELNKVAGIAELKSTLLKQELSAQNIPHRNLLSILLHLALDSILIYVIIQS